MISFLTFNCGPLYTVASLILEKLFSRSSLYDIVCFSILAGGTQVYATIISKGPVLMPLFLIVDQLYGCFSCFRGLFQ